MSDDHRPDPQETDGPENPEKDAIEAEAAIDAAGDDTAELAEDGPEEVAESEDEAEEAEAAPEPAAKLDRLQKILAQAGIASRRHAEELITEGRVQVNGKVVTELGTKADAVRDHIRVDGKLLQGSERLRYFMLNKPKGFVTTVSDPEHRPTVMEFFTKIKERVYPVGRLDYLSEGLLLMTNDGELANKLTRAASGVEKTYLVKVSGEPSEEAIESLFGGLSAYLDQVSLFDSRRSAREFVGQVAVVGHQQEPLAQIIQPPDRVEPLAQLREELHHGRPLLGITDRGDEALGLVEHEVAEAL